MELCGTVGLWPLTTRYKDPILESRWHGGQHAGQELNQHTQQPGPPHVSCAWLLHLDLCLWPRHAAAPPSSLARLQLQDWSHVFWTVVSLSSCHAGDLGCPSDDLCCRASSRMKQDHSQAQTNGSECACASTGSRLAKRQGHTCSGHRQHAWITCVLSEYKIEFSTPCCSSTSVWYLAMLPCVLAPPPPQAACVKLPSQVARQLLPAATLPRMHPRVTVFSSKTMFTAEAEALSLQQARHQCPL